MGDTSEYLVYVVNVGWRNAKFGRSYIIFGDVCYEIEFTEAYSHKHAISLIRVVIMRIRVKDMKKTCWWWCG